MTPVQTLDKQTPATSDPQAVLAAYKKDTARRLAGYANVFDEIAKTLSALADHRLLKDDGQFLASLDALNGCEDANQFHDRILSLISYVGRVAKAHGVQVSDVSLGISDTSILQQRPDNLVDPDAPVLQRTRLQVR